VKNPLDKEDFLCYNPICKEKGYNMIININLVDNKSAKETIETLMGKLTDEEKYNLAINLLSKLEDKGYCIWQAYSKEDIEHITGRKKLEKQDMEEYQNNLETAATCYGLFD